MCSSIAFENSKKMKKHNQSILISFCKKNVILERERYYRSDKNAPRSTLEFEDTNLRLLMNLQMVVARITDTPTLTDMRLFVIYNTVRCHATGETAFLLFHVILGVVNDVDVGWEPKLGQHVREECSICLLCRDRFTPECKNAENLRRQQTL